MKYPILYKSNETDFFAMGLGPIQMLKATVTQERNGIFIFEGEILTDNPLFPLVLENYIIKADADHLLKDQRFRIKRIVPNHDGKAQIYAEHVSYLSRELTIKPEVNITGSAQVALSQWKASIVESNPFVVSSDITTSASTKWRIDKVENPMMALGGVEGSILDRWGGEYLFDNYHISLLKKRGKTATNILAYGRNITDFEQERNILSTYTSIAPYAIYTNDSEKEIVVTVDGFVVDSEHVNKFPNRVTKPIDFSSEFGSGEIPTKARLTTLAQQYIEDNEIGVPTTSIKISFLDLSQTADYADYAFLEQVNLCDDVRVHYPKLGVNTIAKVVRVVWNCLTESYDEIEIGQKRMSLASQIQEQNKVIQEINTQTNQAQVSADGKNMIFYGLYGANGLGQPTATKIGDSWFKPNGLETELYVWTGIEWKLIMSTSSFGEIEDTIKTLDDELEQTTTTANDAVNKAEQAVRDAGFATDIAEEAKALGVTASTLADNAKINADNAISDAQNALNKAIKSSIIHYALSANGSTPPATGWQTSNPNPTEDQYVWTRTTITLNDDSTIESYSVGKIGATGSQGPKGDTGSQGAPGVNAPTIKSVVRQFYLSTSKTSQTGGSWLSTVPVWSSGKYYWVRVLTTYSNGTTSQSTPVLDNALNESLVTALEAKTANQDLSTTVTQHATLIEGKANSTTVDAIDGRVTDAEGSITAIAGQVALKASTTDVDAIKGRVTTAEGKITAQAGLIELKAAQSEVDTLTGKVTAAEASITATDGKITALTTKTDGNTTQIGQLQTGYDGLSSTVTALETGKVGTVAFSALEQNLAGFKTTVQNTYADKTTVTALATQWSQTTELANGHTSAINSLGEQLNLRVTKGELISQINVSPETVLIASSKIQIKGDTYIESGVIKTAHIADLAVSGAKIANATIASAKIISLDASKVTADRLDVITANTGNLNVSGNLTMLTDNNLIKGNYDYSDPYDAYAPRTFVGNFQVGRRFTFFAGDTWEYKNSNPKNYFLGYNETSFGQDYLKMRTYNNSVNRTLLSRFDVYNGRLELSDSFSTTNMFLTKDGDIYGQTVTGERMATNRIDLRGLAAFIINERKEHNLPTLRMTAAEEAIFSIESPSPQKANLYLGGDASPRIWSGAFYSRTYPVAANVVVTDQGTIGRSVSAKKYKTNIQVLDSAIKNAKQVLKIQPKTWWDKRALEETGKIREGYGYIADEFHELGLTEVVQYGANGQIEGLAYDRISMYHNVILQDHEKEISALKTTMNFDIWQLKNEIKELKNEIDSLRQAVV